MTLLIVNRQRSRKINVPFFRQIVLAALEELEIEQAELGIQLVGVMAMARMNWQYLQHEGCTDVITFDHGAAGGPEPTSAAMHGELFICVDAALIQAREFGATWESEVVRYAVHGILHLLGHDDLKPELRRKMKREENRVVRLLERRFTLAQLSRAGKIKA
jgi:probable rRNA maturation factor